MGEGGEEGVAKEEEKDVQLEWAVEIVLNRFLSKDSVNSYSSTDISPLSIFALASFVFWVFLASRGKMEA
jgi:hypothetical protein